MKKNPTVPMLFCFLLAAAFAVSAHDGAAGVPVPEKADCVRRDGVRMPPPPPGQGRFDRKFSGRRLDDFLTRFPQEERERLKKLAEEDPFAFRKEMQQYFEARRKKDLEQLKSLRQAYFDAPDGEAKKKAEEALRTELRAGMQKYLNASERRIQEMEAQLADFQKRLDWARKKQEEQKANMEKEIDRVLKDFTDPAKDPFRMPPPPAGRPSGAAR